MGCSACGNSGSSAASRHRATKGGYRQLSNRSARTTQRTRYVMLSAAQLAAVKAAMQQRRQRRRVLQF